MSYCDTCWFWERGESDFDKKDNMGSCRRHPPKVVGGLADQMVQWGEAENLRELVLVCTVWPQTLAYDRCGEYDRRYTREELLAMAGTHGGT